MKQTRASLNLELQCVSAGEAPIESPTFASGNRAWTKIKRIARDPRRAYRGKQARKNTDLGDDALFSLGPTQSLGTLKLSRCLLGNKSRTFLGSNEVREGWGEMPGGRSAQTGIYTHLHMHSHTPYLEAQPPTFSCEVSMDFPAPLGDYWLHPHHHTH